jgi:hypothetical protein
LSNLQNEYLLLLLPVPGASLRYLVIGAPFHGVSAAHPEKLPK